MNSRLAPAKINLALHVTGQLANGYHLLDSLVCFADFGDWVSVKDSDDLNLKITGPNAAGIPVGGDNLILRAANILVRNCGASILLEKHLPSAAGIGGGSADAAAAMMLLADLWQTDLPDAQTILKLGADIPVCLQAKTARMRGIGDAITPVPQMPAFEAVLVNPGTGLATAEVFGELKTKTNPPMTDLPTSGTYNDWIVWLANQRNDLELASVARLPEITDVINTLSASAGCGVARMSGSGATCFGLFQSRTQSKAAAETIQHAHPKWWVQHMRLGGSPDRPH